MSKKLYRVKKDTFMWAEGAIIAFDEEAGSSGYKSISDVWDTVDLKGEYISAPVVENNPNWFERVYAVSGIKKTRYLAKEAAREALQQLHKTK